jgi:hypothetical protein
MDDIHKTIHYNVLFPFVALANILENTAFFGDILLRLPDISHKILTLKHEWEVLLNWSLGFSNQTHLLDKQTEKLLYLVSS